MYIVYAYGGPDVFFFFFFREMNCISYVRKACGSCLDVHVSYKCAYFLGAQTFPADVQFFVLYGY